MSLADEGPTPEPAISAPGIAMVMFWVTLLAVSILLYVLLDASISGIGMLFA